MNENNKLTLINMKEFWEVFGDINHLLGMLIMGAHWDDEEMTNSGLEACAMVMTKLIRSVVPSASREEIASAIDESYEKFNAHRDTFLRAKSIIDKRENFTNDRN